MFEIFVNLEEVKSDLTNQLKNKPHITKVRLNPHLYQELSLITDNVRYGIDILEDPIVDTFKVE